MDPLGPWAATGCIGIAVSGGADSLCLAVLAARWASARGIDTLGLIVDHGLRAASADEAVLTAQRLVTQGIDSRILTLSGLGPGSALAERARAARYSALTASCRNAGIVDLLVGHHAGDQAETVLMRRRAGSGPDGLAGMASLAETDDLRILRPLLALVPDRMRETLRALRLDWVEDPSNHDQRALRTRLRYELGDPVSQPGLALGLLQEAAAEGSRRMARDIEQAHLLAGSAMLRPEGFAVLPPRLVPARALAALIRTVAGASYPPMLERVAALIRNPRPATLAGARLMPAGKLGPGWLLLREAAQIGAAVEAVPGALWDGRFRLHAGAGLLPRGTRIGALGVAGAAERSRTGLPSAVLAVMPALQGPDGVAVDQPEDQAGRFRFEPTLPATLRPVFLGTVASR